jgi:hypothetical protein
VLQNTLPCMTGIVHCGLEGAITKEERHAIGHFIIVWQACWPVPVARLRLPNDIFVIGLV